MLLSGVFLYCYATAHDVEIEGVGYGTAELLTEGVCVELLNVHHRSVILAREPALAVLRKRSA